MIVEVILRYELTGDIERAKDSLKQSYSYYQGRLENTSGAFVENGVPQSYGAKCIDDKPRIRKVKE